MEHIFREDSIRLIGSVRRLVRQEIDLSTYLKGVPEENLEMDVDNCKGVSNGFLSELIYSITGLKAEVVGKVEDLFSCPCCGFRTLTERYDKNEGTGYDICAYCTWEDGGTTDIYAYRSLNKGSIADYRNEISKNLNKYYMNKWIKGDRIALHD